MKQSKLPDMSFDKIAPCFIVDNVKDTVGFYTEKLGFEIDFLGEAPLFAMLKKENITIMLRQLKKMNLARPNRIAHLEAGWHTQGANAWDAYLWVEGVEELYSDFVSKGVSIIAPLGEREYGNVDFEIEDNNGYILCFGEAHK